MFVNSSSSSLDSAAGSGDVDGHRALLMSRALSVSISSTQRRPAQCLQLTYHLAAADDDAASRVSCLLSVHVMSVSRRLNTVWSQNCHRERDDDDDSWQDLQLPLNYRKPFHVSYCTVSLSLSLCSLTDGHWH